MIPFYLYDGHGRIRSTGSVARTMVSDVERDATRRGCAVVFGIEPFGLSVDAQAQCVVDGELVDRRPIGCKWFGPKLAGLPVPCRVRVNGIPTDVVGGEFTLTEMDAHVTIDEPTYLREEWYWKHGALVHIEQLLSELE